MESLLVYLILNIPLMAGYPSNLAKKYSPTEPFPQHILPLLPLYNAQWWGYESLTAIVLVCLSLLADLGQIVFFISKNKKLSYSRARKCIVGKLKLVIPPLYNVGGYTGFALSRRSFGRSFRPSVSNSCPFYNSFTNGRISFKLE